MGPDQEYLGQRVAARHDRRSGTTFDPAVVGPAVDRLAELAGGRAALEFAIGTGRIALPLAGIDSSEAMLARLREKPGAPSGSTRSPATWRRRVPSRWSISSSTRSSTSPRRTGRWRAASTRRRICATVVTQRSSGHHLIEGDRIEPSPIELRYAWPAELDLMARLAGMRLDHRRGGWGREPFTGLSPAHVSAYVKP